MKKYYWYVIGIVAICGLGLAYAGYLIFQMMKANEEAESIVLEAAELHKTVNLNSNGHVPEETTIKAEN